MGRHHAPDEPETVPFTAISHPETDPFEMVVNEPATGPIRIVNPTAPWRVIEEERGEL